MFLFIYMNLSIACKTTAWDWAKINLNNKGKRKYYKKHNYKVWIKWKAFSIFLLICLGSEFTLNFILEFYCYDLQIGSKEKQNCIKNNKYLANQEEKINK